MTNTGYQLQCKINGSEVECVVAPTQTMLDILRDELGMTGTKISCEMGRCGACMVLVDNKPINTCLLMAYQCSGKELVTIEGISARGIDPIQQAFMEEGGFQCGYCTPGMIVAVKGLLHEHPNPTREQVEEGLSGNICRCTGYGAILRAVERAIELTTP